MQKINITFLWWQFFVLLISPQAAVGFEYQGKTEEHASQKGVF